MAAVIIASISITGYADDKSVYKGSIPEGLIQEEFSRMVECPEDCGKLPIDITDCYCCLYNNWDNDLKEYVFNISEKYEIKEGLILAIIWNESRFQSNVTSTYGSSTNYGLMQINSVTFEYLKEKMNLKSMEHLLDPKLNILAGVELLQYHKEHTDNEMDMLIRYQEGEGNFNDLKASGIISTGLSERVLGLGIKFDEGLI